jgi:hypothetical protein
MGAAVESIGHSSQRKNTGSTPGFSCLYTPFVTSGQPLSLWAASSCGKDHTSIQSGYILLGICKMIVDAEGRLWYMGSYNGRLGVLE